MSSRKPFTELSGFQKKNVGLFLAKLSDVFRAIEFDNEEEDAGHVDIDPWSQLDFDAVVNVINQYVKVSAPCKSCVCFVPSE